jgi:hypothetical protein
MAVGGQWRQHAGSIGKQKRIAHVEENEVAFSHDPYYP